MDITDFLVMDDMGVGIPGDPQGNCLAFWCMECSHPVVAIASQGAPGSDEDHPATCRDCKAQYYLDVRPYREKLYIQRPRSAAERAEYAARMARRG